MNINQLLSPLLAGMPELLPEDIETVFRVRQAAHERLQVISFFLLAIFISTMIVWGLWNFLVREFPRLPRLTFSKAFAVVVMWGLLFVIVLTMISGARELMTPGAWKKQGVTYILDDSKPEPASHTP